MGSITARAYGDGLDLESTDDLDAVSDLLEQDCDFVWVDLDDPAPSELQHLADELGLHHLSVEDALDPHQRDKYVHYGRHVFLVCHALELDVKRAELVTTELDVFIGDRWLVTVHSGRRDLVERFVARWERSRELGGRSVGFALYGILDVVVDGYFDAIDQFEAFYDEAADRVFAETPIEPSAQRQWFEMRRALNQFDRIIGPLAEALATIVDQDLSRFPDAAAPYLRDSAGEIARASTEVDGLRDLVNHIVDANLVLRGYRQGVITKKITSWAAVIAVPTLVTGYYGMNVPYPGSGETWGVVASTAIALGCSGSLYVLFRRKQWL
jgi:magnesium transporter